MRYLDNKTNSVSCSIVPVNNPDDGLTLAAGQELASDKRFDKLSMEESTHQRIFVKNVVLYFPGEYDR